MGKMGIIKYKSTKIIILIILAMLPAVYPFGGRDYFIFTHIPSFIDQTDMTFAPWVLIFSFIWVTLIWCLYGHLSALWFGRSKKLFFICNIPVIVNAVLEIIYYCVLGFSCEDHTEIAYWIGSHIDLVNPQHIFPLESIPVSIMISVGYYFLLYWGASNIGSAKMQ